MLKTYDVQCSYSIAGSIGATGTHAKTVRVSAEHRGKIVENALTKMYLTTNCQHVTVTSITEVADG